MCMNMLSSNAEDMAAKEAQRNVDEVMKLGDESPYLGEELESLWGVLRRGAYRGQREEEREGAGVRCEALEARYERIFAESATRAESGASRPGPHKGASTVNFSTLESFEPDRM